MQIATNLPSPTELTAKTRLAVGTVRHAIDVLALEPLVQKGAGERDVRDQFRFGRHRGGA